MNAYFMLFALLVQASIPARTAFRKPAFSSAAIASMVVPAGEHTISFNSPGCFPVSRTIFALPSTACSQPVSLTAREPVAHCSVRKGFNKQKYVGRGAAADGYDGVNEPFGHDFCLAACFKKCQHFF